MQGKVFLAIALVLSILSGYSCDEDNEDWWKHMQLYQIYPRSFKDSDGDGIGDINGIRSKLQHLADIGVNATWLSPVYPSPMVDFGYDIADYYNIAEEYGTIADLEALIAEAKEKNIRILLDFVPNHTSDKNEWFVKSVNREPGFENFYVWHDGRDGGASPPSNWISVFRGSAWTFHPIRRQWYLHQFAKEQPDLNYRDPLVVEEMKNVLKFWLAKGVQGFRVDAIPHLVEVDVDASGNYPDEPLSGNSDDPESYDYLEHIYTRERNLTYQIVYDWRATFDQFAEDTASETIVLLMEAMSSVDYVMAYYGNGTSEGAHFPFNFNLAFLDKSANARVLEDNIVGWFNNLPEGRVTNWVVGNHDQPRTATRFGPARSDGILMIAMLLPGVAVTYNGEEIAMENFYLSWEETVDPQGCNAGIDLFNSSSRDPERTPFQWDGSKNSGFSTADKTWLPVASNFLELNLEKQKSDERSAYKFYKDLSSLRQDEVLQHGDLTVKSLSDDILAFTRVLNANETVVVVVNNGGSAAAGVNLQNSFQGVNDNLSVLISSVSSARRPGQTLQSSNFVLQAYEALALQ